MQKKNVLTMALSVSLVGVIAVGGTLAYLTSTTEKVTNTFTGSAGITMTLDEAKVGQDGQAIVGSEAARVKKNEYSNILPGVEYDKDPTVTLNTVPTGGVYVFARIEGLDTTGTDQYTVSADLSNQWSKVSAGDGMDGIYVYIGDDADADAAIVTGTGALDDIFEHVTFTYDQSGAAAPAIKKINVVAYAIQASGIEYDSEDPDEDTALSLATATLNSVDFD